MGCCKSKTEEKHEFENRPQSRVAEGVPVYTIEDILPLPTVESDCNHQSWDFTEIDSNIVSPITAHHASLSLN